MKQFLLIAALALFVGAGCSTDVQDTAETTDTPEVAEEATLELEAEETDEKNEGEEEDNTAVEVEVEDEEEVEDEKKPEQENVKVEETKTPTTQEETTNAAEPVVKNIDGTYKISTGVSTYMVKKEFFGKSTDDVNGSTSDLSGTVTINGNKVSVDATIQNTFSSGSGGRDGEVKKLLKGPITISGKNLTIANIKELATTRQTMNLNLTIAGVTKSIPFTLDAYTNDNKLGVEGAASFNMETDFGIKPPSVLKVYTVHPEMTVVFKLQAFK